MADNFFTAVAGKMQETLINIDKVAAVERGYADGVRAGAEYFSELVLGFLKRMFSFFTLGDIGNKGYDTFDFPVLFNHRKFCIGKYWFARFIPGL